MLNRPSNQVLAALAHLQGNPQFETVRSWLEESLQHLYVNAAVTKDEVLVRWHQGAAQAVDDLLDHAKNARDALSKSR